MTELLSTPEAAAALGVTEGRIRQLIREGRLPARRIGGRWVVEALVLAAFTRPRRGWPKGRARRPA